MSVLKEYFNYSKHERRGIFILLSIIFALILYNQFVPKLISYPTYDYQAFKLEIDGFLAAQEVKNKPHTIEINSADTSAFISLPGIGSYFAKRIIKYRELLGGYYRKEQLLEVYGMDSIRYQKFHQYIKVDTSKISRININQVEFKELLKHPYLDYEMVKEIFNYKRKVKQIRDIEALRSSKGINNKTFARIKPYLRIN